MKLRFEVDQAEAFRQGVDVPKSIVTVEVDPSKLSQEQRNLIADRLDGIDVCVLAGFRDGKPIKILVDGKPVRMLVKLPTFESLMEAVIENQNEAKEESNLLERIKRGEVDLTRITGTPGKKREAVLERFIGKPKI